MVSTDSFAAISLFSDQKNWPLLLRAIDKMPSTDCQKGKQLVELNHTGGDHIRLSIIVDGKDDPDFLKTINDYFIYFFSKSELWINETQPPTSSLFMPFLQNTIQYGLFQTASENGVGDNEFKIKSGISQVIVEALKDESGLDRETLLTLALYLHIGFIKLLIDQWNMDKEDILNYYDYHPAEHGQLVSEAAINIRYEESLPALKDIVQAIFSDNNSEWMIHWIKICTEFLCQEIFKSPGPKFEKAIYFIQNEIKRHLNYDKKAEFLLFSFIIKLLDSRILPCIIKENSLLNINEIESLGSFQKQYLEIPSYQRRLSSYMLDKLASDSQLAAYRQFVKNNAYGLGADEFMIMWDWIVKSMPSQFSFCEIGVHKGQILTLVEMLASRDQKKVVRYGISPMNGANTRYQSNFHMDVKELHRKFSLNDNYTIIEGFSTDKRIIREAMTVAPFDILYIDGSHEKNDVKSDFDHYLPMIAINGILVVDDSNSNMPCTYGPPFEDGGKFWGIQDVSDITDQEMNSNKSYEYIGSIIHNRIWRKLS